MTRANGKAFRNGGDKAELKLPDGRGGPAFLMTKNFCVLKAYNNADKYALAVGLLADEIAGYGGLVSDWKRPFTKLSFAEKQELAGAAVRRTAIMTASSTARSAKAPNRHQGFSGAGGLDAGRPSKHGSALEAEAALGAQD